MMHIDKIINKRKMSVPKDHPVCLFKKGSSIINLMCNECQVMGMDLTLSTLGGGEGGGTLVHSHIIWLIWVVKYCNQNMFAFLRDRPQVLESLLRGL